MLNDSRLDRNDGPNLTDAIEWFVDSIFVSLGKLATPWRWFQGGATTNSRRRRLMNLLQWRVAMVAETIASLFFRSLEALERGMATALIALTFAISPWRWGKRTNVPEDEEI